MTVTRLPIVGVMGASEHAHHDLADPLGALLAGLPVHLLTGAGQGVMGAVSKAFAQVKGRAGLCVGIVPASSLQTPAAKHEGYPNDYVELAIRTHLITKQPELWDGLTRNHINVLTADAVIALPGSNGTAHEIEMAIAYGRPVATFFHRADEMGALPDSVHVCGSVADVHTFLSETLGV